MEEVEWRPELNTPDDGMIPGSGTAKSNAPEWAAGVPTKEGRRRVKQRFNPNDI